MFRFLEHFVVNAALRTFADARGIKAALMRDNAKRLLS